MKHKRLSNVDHAEVIKVIRILSLVGTGTDEDPFRQITEYFDLKGNRIARTDYLSEVENIHEWKK